MVDFRPVYGTLNETQLLRAQQNQAGSTDIPFTVTVYLFPTKIRCRFHFHLVLEDVRCLY